MLTQLQQSQSTSSSPPNFDLDTPSGAVTPATERAPLFAHECFGPPYEKTEACGPAHTMDGPSAIDEYEAEIDADDPMLETFPNDRQSIIAQVKSTGTRLNHDETAVEAVPSSPILHTTEKLELLSPSPRIMKADRSPSMKSIVEENDDEDEDEDEDTPINLPSPTHRFSSITKPGLVSTDDDENIEPDEAQALPSGSSENDNVIQTPDFSSDGSSEPNHGIAAPTLEPNNANMAISTSTDESINGIGSLRMRSAPSNINRSRTPDSIHPPKKNYESRNFLKAFWQTVFVGWIGGLIARLCGDRRHA